MSVAAPSRHRPRHDVRVRRRRDALLLFGLSVLLLSFFLFIYPLRGFGFPIGPDGPVYMWWSRVAQHDGLGAVGPRAGLPALALMVAGTVNASIVAALAALAAAMGATVGLGAFGLVSLAGTRGAGRTTASAPEDDAAPSAASTPAALLAGLLAGAFAVHVADGFFASLSFLALFLAAAACLLTGTTAGAAGAALLLAAGALAHPLFFLLGAGILLVAALPTLRRRPAGQRFRHTDAGRTAAAVLAGAAVGGGLLAAVVASGASIRADTSKDAFLRRAGLGHLLRGDYLDRLVRHLARYWLPISVPLAAYATRLTRGRLGRLFRAWWLALLLGVVVAIVSGLLPADRFITSGYVLPIGAALGAMLVWRRLAPRRKALATAVCAVLVGLMLAGALVTWLRARPFVEEVELRAVAQAARVAEAAPPGTPLVFLIDNRQRSISFLATRAGNVIRAGLPTDLVRRVHIYVGSPRHYVLNEPTLIGAEEHDALSRLYLRDLQAVGGRPLAFVLRPFNPRGFTGSQYFHTGTVAAKGVVALGDYPAPVPGAPHVIPPAPSWTIVSEGFLVLLLLGAVGLGWARRAVGGGLAAWALAPACGAAALLLAGVVLDRLGATLAGPAPPVTAAAIAVAGYAVSLVHARAKREEPRVVVRPGSERVAAPEPTRQVDE